MKASKELRRIAEVSTPKVRSVVREDFFRHDVVRGLSGTDNIGIELGVAGGHFSKRMLDSGKFKCFYGVDLYEDHHDVGEYKRALQLVGLEKNYYLLRMSFDEALGLFEDAYFDFIYFDGYAHTGEEGGKTFLDWYEKLKVGGVFAGDDYHPDWPLVVWAVNSFAESIGADIEVTGRRETSNPQPLSFLVPVEERAPFGTGTRRREPAGHRLENQERDTASVFGRCDADGAAVRRCGAERRQEPSRTRGEGAGDTARRR